ncbi:hypothetical protein BDY21DRAFT_200952 [Lineolata rhizophorae]|uniref:Secreted protein n=1 Tax=Lineolata rhizophorae TaxID=578093 RepID=A0A6A6P532_9PEZI|nr:hypothetical protein BDY21DRAFT_200952 [Lineolata rhizophorae]
MFCGWTVGPPFSFFFSFFFLLFFLPAFSASCRAVQKRLERVGSPTRPLCPRRLQRTSSRSGHVGGSQHELVRTQLRTCGAAPSRRGGPFVSHRRAADGSPSEHGADALDGWRQRWLTTKESSSGWARWGEAGPDRISTHGQSTKPATARMIPTNTRHGRMLTLPVTSRPPREGKRRHVLGST